MSTEAVVERLTSIEKLLQELIVHQKKTSELLQKVLPEAISQAVDEEKLKMIAKTKDKSPKNRIIAALAINPEGLSLLAIAKTTGLARNTVKAHIKVLKNKNIIRIERVGGATGTKCILRMTYDDALKKLVEVKPGPA